MPQNPHKQMSKGLASRYSLKGNTKQCLVPAASKPIIFPLPIDWLLLPSITG